jgi:hypothetical protein
MWQFLLGLLIGTALGMIVMAALVAASRKP